MLTLEERFEKTKNLAMALFPNTKWVQIEPHIWVAESRLSEKIYEPSKWEKELIQVRILTTRGSVVFFLPEQSDKRCADIILDGVITELKTVSGNRETLGKQFRYGFKQGSPLSARSEAKEHSVFIHLLSDLSVGSVKAKIAGELKTLSGKGSFICYFENTKNLYEWTYAELQEVIGA
jgi:hypothetical protein